MNDIVQKLRHSDHGGYTLIELLVIIAILGTITAVMAMTINMALQITTTDTAQNILISQVHQGASWISKDVASADNITPIDNSTTLFYMKRYQWNGADNITSTTTITYSVDSKSNLLRNGSIVAQFIKYPDIYTTFTATENNTYLLKLKASYGNSSYKQQFKIYQRLP